MEQNVTCPYCNYENEIDPDWDNCNDGDTYELECSECEKTFGTTVHTSIELDWEWFKMDCKNDGDHDYSTACTFMGDHTTRVCWSCGRQEVPRPAKPYPIPESEQYHFDFKLCSHNSSDISQKKENLPTP